MCLCSEFPRLRASTAEMHCLPVLEAGGWRPEIRVSAGLVPPRDCEGEDLSQASHSLVDGHLLPSLSSLCACLCGHISPFYKDTNHIELGLTLIIFILT